MALKAKNIVNGAALEKSSANLLYQIATKLKSQIKFRLPLLVESVVNKNLTTEPQLNGKHTLIDLFQIKLDFFFHSRF